MNVAISGRSRTPYSACQLKSEESPHRTWLCCDCDTVMPYPGAPDAIRSLRAIPQVEMICVTSNPGKDAEAFLQAKKRWLHKYIPELSDQIVSAKAKTNLGLDILIDFSELQCSGSWPDPGKVDS